MLDGFWYDEKDEDFPVLGVHDEGRIGSVIVLLMVWIQLLIMDEFGRSVVLTNGRGASGI